MKSVIKTMKRILRRLILKAGYYPFRFQVSSKINFVKYVYFTAKMQRIYHSVATEKTDDLKRLREYHEIYKGKRCFIIGNGPSLNKLDLTLLKDEYTFGANAIYLHKEKMGGLPKFMAVTDYLVAEDRCDELNQLEGVTMFIPVNLTYVIKPRPNVVLLKYYYPDVGKKIILPHNLTEGAYGYGSVSFLNLQLAFHMGFQEVYLIGMDHTYKDDKAFKRVVSKFGTSAGERIVESDDQNHFHPDYFGKGYRWHDPKIEPMILSHEYAKESYEADGRNIFNATFGGKLEVYERVDYNSLF